MTNTELVSMSEDELYIILCVERWLGRVTTHTRLKRLSSNRYLMRVGLFAAQNVNTDVYTQAALTSSVYDLKLNCQQVLLVGCVKSPFGTHYEALDIKKH